MIHKDLAAEMTPLIDSPAFDQKAPWQDDLESWIHAARDRFGEAIFEDEQLIVFRLADP